MTAYLSQKKAIRELKAQTGLTLATCTAKVTAIALKKDGERKKVHRTDLQKAITELSQPVRVPKDLGIKGLSPEQRG
jgi:hypothetical protein